MISIILSVFLQLSLSQSAIAQNCRESEVWVSPHPRKSFTKEDGTFVSATEVVGHCRSKSRAYDFWHSKFGNQPISDWPLPKEAHKPWSRDNLEEVVKALNSVSEWLWADDVKLYRYMKSQIPGNPASTDEWNIVLYDKAFDDKKMLSRYLTHELAHVKFRKMSKLDRTAFQAASGWKMIERKGRSKLVNLSPRRASHDSDISPDEDFANTIEFYVHEPMRLKVKNPQVYDWIEIEYGDNLKSGGKSK